jgi:hypothetical protein
MASARARNSGEEGETREERIEAAWYDRAAAVRLDMHVRDVVERAARRSR